MVSIHVRTQRLSILRGIYMLCNLYKLWIQYSSKVNDLNYNLERVRLISFTYLLRESDCLA